MAVELYLLFYRYSTSYNFNNCTLLSALSFHKLWSA